MNTLKHGRLVYPKSFVLQEVPIPASWDTRPVPLLLRGRHPNPQNEINRIERWYSELRGLKKGVRARLRDVSSISNISFWSVYHELMADQVFRRFGNDLGRNIISFVVIRGNRMCESAVDIRPNHDLSLFRGRLLRIEVDHRFAHIRCTIHNA